MKIYITTYDERIGYAKKVKEMMKNSHYEYFFVYGKGNKEKLEPFIEVDVDESYENLPTKTFCLVEHFFNNFKDEKLLKMDDDTFVDLEKIKRYENAKEDYMGYVHHYGEHLPCSKFFHWYKIKNPKFRIFKKVFDLMYCEGAFYILSRKACEKIISDGRDFYTNTTKKYMGEDVHVGVSMNDGILVRKDIKADIPLEYEITEDFTSIHPVNILLFDKILATKTNEEKLKILEKYNFLNENVIRMKYLGKIHSMVINNQPIS